MSIGTSAWLASPVYTDESRRALVRVCTRLLTDAIDTLISVRTFGVITAWARRKADAIDTFESIWARLVSAATELRYTLTIQARKAWWTVICLVTSQEADIPVISWCADESRRAGIVVG